MLNELTLVTLHFQVFWYLWFTQVCVVCVLLGLLGDVFLNLKVKSIKTREDAKLLLTQNVYIKKGEILEIDNLIKTQNPLY